MKIKLPLTLRLLLFNVLVLFLPIATLLYLDTYEKQLLTLQERAMVQQGRIMSAALRDKDLSEADRILHNLEQRLEARIRVLDNQGRLISDSAVTIRQESPNIVKVSESYSPIGERISGGSLVIDERVRENTLYRLFGWLYQLYKKVFLPPEPDIESGNFYIGRDQMLGEEVQAALQGRYGAVTRVSTGEQRSVNLYSALPVFYGDTVSGVILVSQSTLKILDDLYKLRLDIIRIFSLSLLFSLLISLLLSLQITGPIVRLSRKAEEVLDPHGQFRGHFPVFRRRDELGDLSRSLQGLSSRLEKKMLFIDTMTADMVHEFKNPLGSISSSLQLVKETEENKQFLLSMNKQILRMDGLLNQLREVTSIEQQMDQEDLENLSMKEFLPFFLTTHANYGAGKVQLDFIKDKDFILKARGDRLAQIFSNLLDNALSFSSKDKPVSIEINASGNSIAVIDYGPGVALGNRSRLFDRFFSDRQEIADHSGLGLAIVKAVMQGYGGTVSYEETPGGGSTFRLLFPRGK